MQLRSVFFILFLLTMFGMPGSAQFSYTYLDVLYDSAWTYQNLQMIPIRFKAGRGEGDKMGYLSLGQAMMQGKARIREVPSKIGTDKGSVTITNKSKQTILIKSGEMIGGGKQDRILRQTTLIPPGQKKEIVTVFCIEKDRWDDKPKSFFYGGSGDIELRKAIDVSRSQASVWKEIDRQYTVGNASSKTWSYLKLFNDSTRNMDYARYFKRKFEESKGGFAGFLFVSGNHIMGVELFSKADYTTTSFDAMTASYINSVSSTPDPPLVSQGRQKTFLDNVLTTRETQSKLIRKQGAAHKQDGQLLHIVVYGTGF
jgi:hypothetical protein